MTGEENKQILTVEALVQALRDNAGALGLTWQLRPATVVFNTNGIASVRYDGGDEVETRAVPLIESVYADDRVMVMHVPPSSNYIIGYATASTGRGPGGRVATSLRTTSSAAITTVETIVDTVTAPLVAGRTYKVSWDFAWTQSVATDAFFARIREDIVTGTQLQGFRLMAGETASSFPAHRECEYTAVTTGDKTFVGTFVRTGGTGSVQSGAAATNPQLFYVDYVSG